LTEVEVLQALPTTLDGDALAAFYAILPDQRGTFLRAFAQMAAIFDPPSNVRHKFAARRRGETETPLTFRSTNVASAGHLPQDGASWAGLFSIGTHADAGSRA
ncbi:unnamed protein product, partial [Lampetra planeri]